VQVYDPHAAATKYETWAYDLAGRVTGHDWLWYGVENGDLNWAYDAEGRTLTASDVVNGLTRTLTWGATGRGGRRTRRFSHHPA